MGKAIKCEACFQLYQIIHVRLYFEYDIKITLISHVWLKKSLCMQRYYGSRFIHVTLGFYCVIILLELNKIVSYVNTNYISPRWVKTLAFLLLLCTGAKCQFLRHWMKYFVFTYETLKKNSLLFIIHKAVNIGKY